MPMPAVVLLSAPVLCWIVPPLAGVPLPTIFRPPLDPVVSITTPFPALPAAVPAEMLRNVRFAPPMVEFTALSAVPVVEEIVLMIVVLSWVALIDATPFALKPMPAVVVIAIPLLKLIVPP